MACCLLAALFVGGVWAKPVSAGDDSSSRERAGIAASLLLSQLLGRRWRTWILVLAVLEVAAAATVVGVILNLFRADASGSQPHHAMTSHDPTWAVISSVVLLVVALGLNLRAWSQRSGPLQAALGGVGVLLLLGALVMVAGPPTGHTVLMAQLMTAAAAAPALLASAFARTRVGPPLPASILRVALPTVSLVWVIAVFGWHVSLVSAPDWATSTSAVLWALVASAAVGTALWGLLVADTRAELFRTRMVALLVAGIPMGLLGLAMIVSPEPMTMVADGGLLSASADQRIGGLLMMLADLAVLVPTIDRLMSARGRSAADAPHRTS